MIFRAHLKVRQVQPERHRRGKAKRRTFSFVYWCTTTLTFPILPAPIVLPRIQSPTCLCPLDLAVAYLSDADVPLWATDGAGCPFPGIVEGPVGSGFEWGDVVIDVVISTVSFAISSIRLGLRSTPAILPAVPESRFEPLWASSAKFSARPSFRRKVKSGCLSASVYVLEPKSPILRS